MNSYALILKGISAEGAELPVWGAWIIAVILFIISLLLFLLLGNGAYLLWKNNFEKSSILMWTLSVLAFIAMLAWIAMGIVLPAYEVQGTAM